MKQRTERKKWEIAESEVSSLKTESQCSDKEHTLQENFSSWSNSPSNRRVANRMSVN